ncbi:MAG TPA: transposase [Bacteroidetes bacterium]|nr:transposase [Bacteroidota bacterium]
MKSHVILSLDARQERKDGTYPIILRLTHKRKSTSIQTGYTVSLSDWDEKRKAIRATYKGVDSVTRLNNLIQQKKVHAFSLISKLEEQGQLEQLSISELRQRITNEKSESCFLKYTLTQVELLKKSGRYGSARAYHSMYQVIEKFHKKEQLPFIEVSVAFLKKLEVDYLSRGNSYNGLAAILRSLRAVYNKAIQDNLIEKTAYPFEVYKIKKNPTAKRAISQDAITRILSLELDEKHECFHARNYFLFSYLAFGLNFTDAAWMKVKDIADGRIRYTRRKTKQIYDLKIFEAMNPIIAYYAEGKKPNDFLFPIIKRPNLADQHKDVLWARKVYNTRLKKLATLCKIEENLTSYVSRHSAATQALFLGIPVVAISKLLGHSSLSVTQTYLKSLPDNIIDSYHEMLEQNLVRKA